MTSTIVATILALLIAVPAFPGAGKAAVEASQPALHLMNDEEFALFLKRLDAGVLKWNEQLRQIDTRSLSLNEPDAAGLQRTYDVCLQSLGDARKEIKSLSEKQSLKLDFLLLVDLNDLARNLDELTRDLIDASDGKAIAPSKSLEYAKGVLRSDAALTTYSSEFQRHILAFAALIDATRDQTEDATDSPKTQSEIGPLQGNGDDTNPTKERLQ